MRIQLSIIILVFILCAIATQSTSKYEGVSWNEKRNLWQAEVYINDKKQTFYFDNDFDAAKKLNTFCDKMKILSQNSEICEMPNQQKYKTKSQYKGVYWHNQMGKWCAQLDLSGEKTKNGGFFKDELAAAKRVNQLCAELGILAKNPTISALPNQQYHKKEKISQYKGVTWHKQSGKWFVQLLVKGEKTKYGGSFKDELDAGKRVNQLCEKLGIPQQNPGISTIPNQQYQKIEKTSQYKGVCWNSRCGKWFVLIHQKGQNSKYGGMFKDELDAGKRVNQLCEELCIPPHNPEISATPNQQYQKKYKGVYWNRECGKWYAKVCLKGGKQKYGGMFKDELDAVKRVNQVCEELGIPPQNPAIDISAIPNKKYQKQEKTSQYKGVTWHKLRKKWYVLIYPKGKKGKSGGMFKDELDAGKRVNQLCKELEIPLKNPEISGIPNQQYQKKEKISQYKGVYWHKQMGKWYVLIYPTGQKRKYGGTFKDELDAAKRVNQLCEELRIPLQNSTISEMPNQQYQHDDDHKTIANPLISPKILKSDNDDAKKKFNDDNKLPVERFYFYENLLN